MEIKRNSTDYIVAAIAKSMGVDYGYIGMIPEDAAAEIRKRKKALADSRRAKVHARAVCNPFDEFALPKGMATYTVTYVCGHMAGFILKEGLTDAELQEAYGHVKCDECATADAVARRKEFEAKWGDN